jgi:hypothetical protein
MKEEIGYKKDLHEIERQGKLTKQNITQLEKYLDHLILTKSCKVLEDKMKKCGYIK